MVQTSIKFNHYACTTDRRITYTKPVQGMGGIPPKKCRGSPRLVFQKVQKWGSIPPRFCYGCLEVSQSKYNPREQVPRSANPCIDDRLRHTGPKDRCAYAVVPVKILKIG